MIDRRTFLKLSAGALVLTAAGALTGCGGMNDRPKGRSTEWCLCAKLQL